MKSAGTLVISKILCIRSMPSIPGITRSSSTRCGSFASTRLRASSGSPVTIGVYPALVSVSHKYLRVCGSSSAARMRSCSLSDCRGRDEGLTNADSASVATGTVKLKRDPRPGPSLSAHIRPPCASTMPLQMARPRPDPATLRPWSPPSSRGYFLNR